MIQQRLESAETEELRQELMEQHATVVQGIQWLENVLEILASHYKPSAN
jgi:hypothetical protein